MEKNEQIFEIKRIIKEWGSTTSSELELECSPCINSIGNGKNNVSQLVEHFYPEGVEAVTYHDEVILGEEFISYDDLNEDILHEIYNIMLEYEAGMLKTEKRCQN